MNSPETSLSTLRPDRLQTRSSPVIKRRPVAPDVHKTERRPNQDLRSPQPYRPTPHDIHWHAGPQTRTNLTPVALGLPRADWDRSNDPARDILFRPRSAPPPQSRPYSAPIRNPYDDDGQDRNQDQDWELQAMEQEIHFVKQGSLASTRNAIRIGLEAEETGLVNLSRLAGQSQKLASVETSLDIAAAHVRSAQDKTQELKRLNQSMFAVHLKNPFTSAEKEERRIIAIQKIERLEREKNRRDAYQSAQRVNHAFSTNTHMKETAEKTKPTITSRNPFSFGEDEDDVQIERDINANLDTLAGITSRLKGVALATQVEIDAQLDKIEAIDMKVFIPFSRLELTFRRRTLIRRSSEPHIA